MTDDPFRLDPASFPKRLDLEVSEEVWEHLATASARTGRSIGEVASELLGDALGGHIPEP